jgi:probable HAF family extracellular repeat protein
MDAEIREACLLRTYHRGNESSLTTDADSEFFVCFNPDFSVECKLKKGKQMRLAKFLGALIVTVLLLTTQVQAFIFQGLGDLPGGTFQSLAYGVSNDGTSVVGYSSAYYSSSLNRYEAFRWTSGGGMSGLGVLPVAAESGGTSTAKGVSADGSVVVGASESQAFRWDSNTGMVGLGDLPGGNFSSTANGVSADGSVVVGEATTATGPQAFRWTATGGMAGLGVLPDANFSYARSVSADGSVVVGYTSIISDDSSHQSEAFRWTEGEGMVGLGDLSGNIFASNALAVSADGSVIVGQGYGELGAEAFRWTAASGMVGLGVLPDAYESYATGVSADGSVVVGQSRSFSSGFKAFIWTQANGMQSVEDLLSSTYGVDLSGWTLIEATGISADGKTIVGYGTNSLGQYEAWVANIGVDMSIDIDVIPGDDTNSINLRKDRTISVVVFSATGFAAPSDVDQATLTFGAYGNEPSFKSCSRKAKDVDKDGLADLVCTFTVKTAGFQCGDTEGILQGTTITGVPFEGRQQVLITPCQ